MREIRSLRLVALLFPAMAWGQSAQLNLSRLSHDLGNPITTSTPPASACVWNTITTAFSCDLSFLPMPLGLYTKGTAHGIPTGSQYLYSPNLSNIASYNRCDDGQNPDPGDNLNRTACTNILLKSDNYSPNGGDAATIYFFGVVGAANSSATNFLASTEAGGIQGQIDLLVPGGYAEGVGDIRINDHNNDSAVMMDVRNSNRGSAIGNINSNWGAYNDQAIGTKPTDFHARMSGPHRMGLDASDATFPDQTLVSIVLAGGGSGNVVGHTLFLTGGTCDQLTAIQVFTISSGAVSTFGLDRAGLCSSPPGNPVTFSDGAGGTATFTLQWSNLVAPVMATQANVGWYGNATNDVSVYNTGYSSTTKLGNSYIYYSSANTGWQIVSNNTAVAIFTAGSAIFSPGVRIPAVATSSLPSCGAGNEGLYRTVTDANSTTYNAALVGGGSNHMPVYCNGTGWVLH